MNAELFSKVYEDDEASVLDLLANGADPNCRDEDDFTPLHRATIGENANLVSILVAHGANVEAEPEDCDLTALKFAAINGLVDVARALLEGGALVNRADESGFTPLHHATFCQRAKLVDFLLAHGASPDAPNRKGTTPLHAAASYGGLAFFEAKYGDTDSSSNGLSDYSNTESDYLRNDGDKAIFSALLKHSSRPDMPDRKGNTPLHLAAKTGFHEAVCQLLAVPVQHDIANRDGDTPLHLAAGWGRGANVRILLKHGCQPDCKNNDGETPLHLAISSRRPEAVQEMLAAPLELNAIDPCGRTPLQFTVYCDCFDMARSLLINGAATDACSSKGKTALHYAVGSPGRNHFIDLLLANGARTDIKDRDGSTPLALAKTYRNKTAIKKLVNPSRRCLQPRSLQISCRKAIRTWLIANHPQQTLSTSIDKLVCLPWNVRDYLYSSLAF